jgi:hypothetical protein
MARRNQTKVRKTGTSKIKKLNKEAQKIVDEEAPEIAKSLLKSTLAGHVLSARLLVELAEGDMETDEAIRMRPLSRYASELAEEPQWPDESSEPVVDTEITKRKPESA